MDPARRLALAQRLLSWALLGVGTLYAAWVMLVLVACLREGRLPERDALGRVLLFPLAGCVVGLGGGLFLRRTKLWSG